jgi:hypothetical protein
VGLILSVKDTIELEIAFARVVHLGQTLLRRFLRCVLDPRDMVTLQEIATFDCTIGKSGVYGPSLSGLGVTINMAILGEQLVSYY